ncbi:hypothetical protein LJC58_02720 [Lachnospiraceae bacterium OttesenSCG-928-D06]|nr:hypothetical protein [Lachnospiraceae bacterium OttesenSCG-928-D06]
MDYGNTWEPIRKTYQGVEGVIVEMVPTTTLKERTIGCMLFITVEDVNGNIVNFIVSKDTYILDFETLKEGMQCTFYYLSDRPVPLIYPPQYNAAVIVPERMGEFVFVGYFGKSLISDDLSLQIRVDSSTAMLTSNNQIFMGSPALHNLVVVYETSTRSLPAQTVPKKVVVLCDQGERS